MDNQPLLVEEVLNVCFGVITRFVPQWESYEVDTDLSGKQVTVPASALKYHTSLQVNDEVMLRYRIVGADYDEEEDDGSHIQAQLLTPIVEMAIGRISKTLEEGWMINDDYWMPRDVLEGTRWISYDDPIEYEAVKFRHPLYKYRCVWGKRVPIFMERHLYALGDEEVGRIEAAHANRFGVCIKEMELVFEVGAIGETQVKSFNLINMSRRATRMLRQISIIPDGTAKESQFQVTLPETLPRELGAVSMEIRIEGTGLRHGIFQESIIFEFPDFKLLRSLKLVCGDDKFFKKYNTAYEEPQKPSCLELYENMKHLRKPATKRLNTGKSGLAQKKRRLCFWDIPDDVKALLLDEDWRGPIEARFSFVFKPLNSANYAKKLHHAVFIEELEMFKQFQARNIPDYKPNELSADAESSSYLIDIPNLAESRPSLMVLDRVRCVLRKKKPVVYDGAIVNIRAEAVVVRLPTRLDPDLRYEVSFFYSRTNFVQQHDAIKAVAEGPRFRSLFPTTAVHTNEPPFLDVNLEENGRLVLGSGKHRTPLELTRNDLDSSQRLVLRNVLRGELRALPYLIRGPPGTGKTTTLVEIIMLLVTLVEESRVLVCTQSNSAANLILSKLVDTGRIHEDDVIRVIGAQVYSQGMIPQHLKRHCATLTSPGSETVEDPLVQTDLQLNVLCSYRVVIVTCGCVGNFSAVGISNTHFTHLILDEAGQCLETETIVPIALMENPRSQIVLTGDDKQLGPVVMCRSLEESQFEVSLFERIMRCELYDHQHPSCNKTLSNQLNYNYRSLPSILHLFNALFYNYTLQAMVQSGKKFDTLKLLQAILPENAVRKDTQGVVMFGVLGTNQRSESSPSWLNPKEAECVIYLLEKILALGVPIEEIGIIAPYQGQVRYLQEQMNRRNIYNAKIGSVEEFQGQERSIILLTTVRSEDQYTSDTRYRLGFLANPKRMNVAISRAQSLLVIVGNPIALKGDRNWRRAIQYCAERGTYVETEKDLMDKLLEEASEKKEEDSL